MDAELKTGELTAMELPLLNSMSGVGVGEMEVVGRWGDGVMGGVGGVGGVLLPPPVVGGVTSFTSAGTLIVNLTNGLLVIL